MDNLAREVNRLRFQIKGMAKYLDLENDPILCLAIRLNCGEEDFDAADEIFNEYSNLLAADKDSILPEFEKKLRDRFQIDHQQVKQIVLAFYASGQYVEVCRREAKLYDCSEYKRINNP